MLIVQSRRTMLYAVVVAAFALGISFLTNTPRAYAQENTQWVRDFASSQDIEITAMSASRISEVFIAGTFHGTADFDPGPGEALLASGASDASFIAKYDPAGNLVWANRLGGTGDVRINDIVVDSASQVGVVGSFEGTADLDPGAGVFQKVSKGGHDIFVLRLLPDGNLQWGWADGDSEDDMGFAITADSRWGLYVTGKYEGKIFFQSFGSLTYDITSIGGSDVFVARFSNSGHLSWVNSFGGEEDDSGTDLDLDIRDNVFVVGTFAGLADLDPLHTSTETRSHGRDDIFISLMTWNGASLWQNYMGGTGNESNAKIWVELDGAFFVSGEFENSADFDTLRDGGEITSRGGKDIFLVRFAPAPGREMQWVRGIGGPQNELLAGLVEDTFGHPYVLGSYRSTVDFDLGDGVTELTSSGGADIFLAKYTRLGDLRRVQGLINPQDDRASALAIPASNDVLIAGSYSGTLDLGNGLSINTGKPDGVYNAFVARFARDAWTLLPARSYLPGIIANGATE